MHISGGELQDRPSDVESNRGKDDGVVVKFKANVNIKSQSVYSSSVGNDGLGPFI